MLIILLQHGSSSLTYNRIIFTKIRIWCWIFEKISKMAL